MTDTTDTPITVNANPAVDQLGSAVRALVIALGSYAAGKGWIPADIAGALGTLIVVGVPFVWGQLKMRSLSQKAATMAGHLPDSVAVTR